MEEFTPHELMLMEKMTPQHKALMSRLTPKERKSMAQNVKKPEDIELIQSWIKSDPEIAEMLFWDNGGKFDDPRWQHLKPLDKETEGLMALVSERFKQLVEESVELQRRSDLTLLSQFLPSLLFSGVSGAVRCNENGDADPQGDFFKGVELRCIGSVEGQINSITIYPVGGGAFDIHFGSRVDDAPRGIWVYTGDSYSLLQLAQLVTRTLAKSDFETSIRDSAGNEITLDAKAIRQASMDGDKLDYESENKLYCCATVSGMEAALEKAIELETGFYQRFGLEVECYKIGK